MQCIILVHFCLICWYIAHFHGIPLIIGHSAWFWGVYQWKWAIYQKCKKNNALQKICQVILSVYCPNWPNFLPWSHLNSKYKPWHDRWPWQVHFIYKYKKWIELKTVNLPLEIDFLTPWLSLKTLVVIHKSSQMSWMTSCVSQRKVKVPFY